MKRKTNKFVFIFKIILRKCEKCLGKLSVEIRSAKELIPVNNARGV